MKYELKIDGNILKTDDRDLALEFIKAMTREMYIPPHTFEYIPVLDISPTCDPLSWGTTSTGTMTLQPKPYC